MPYTIAVDARPLMSPLTGVARVITEVIRNFPDKENFLFRLYANRPCHSDFWELLEERHVEWHTASGPLASRGGLWFNLSFPWTLRRAAHRADLFWGSQQILPPFLPRDLPAVLTYYDLVLYYFPEAMRPIARYQQRAFQSMSVRRASHVLSISTQTMEDMCRHFGYPGESASVSLLGYQAVEHTSEDVSALKGRLGFVPEQNYILAVSTIEPRKNYATLLEAYRRYAEQSESPLPLVIAGRRGWESKAFYRRLEELQSQLGSRLVILSGLGNGELDALYAHSAFFCSPSLYEGFGLPLLEALAHGKSGIVSDLPCYHEIAQGFVRFLDPRDVSAWTEALREFGDVFSKKALPKKGGRHKKKAKPGTVPGGLLDPRRFPVEEWSWKRTARAHHQSFCHTLGIE